MPKNISFRSGLLSILFWSIISAAFIGPGTVTTCSKSGATYGLALLWALSFSTVATILLQEAAARITIASGKSLGEAISIQYEGMWGAWIKKTLLFAVVFGCAAYQTGNILGAVAGLSLMLNWPLPVLTLLTGICCALLLWTGSTKIIANTMGMIVAAMGIAFAWVALKTPVHALDITKASLLPSFPDGSSLLIIGLIGTTIVPYNLFLASGIGKGQDIKEMRFGIAIAVAIGGLISMAILIAGTMIKGEYSFQAIAQTMVKQSGSWAGFLFGFGLFAAGFSSAITSPFAAAITAQSLSGNPAIWSVRGNRFRMVWGLVLGTGLLFGLMDIKPIPVIILAQAINGVLLPFVATFLVLAINNRRQISAEYRNSTLANIWILLIVMVTCYLGTYNLSKAILTLPFIGLPEEISAWLPLIVTPILTIWLGWTIFKKSNHK